jgi:hypothetical protein
MRVMIRTKSKQREFNVSFDLCPLMNIATLVFSIILGALLSKILLALFDNSPGFFVFFLFGAALGAPFALDSCSIFFLHKTNKSTTTTQTFHRIFIIFIVLKVCKE